jgi:hypothetical protein
MSKHLDGILIDETHSRAICTEIGERLRSILNENAPAPPRLAALLARLNELDFHESPSIVSEMEAFEPA